MCAVWLWPRCMQCTMKEWELGNSFSQQLLSANRALEMVRTGSTALAMRAAVCPAVSRQSADQWL